MHVADGLAGVRDEARPGDLVLLDPDEVESVVQEEVGGSAKDRLKLTQLVTSAVPLRLAWRVSCAAHSRTCATEPGAELSWSEYSVWIESITHTAGASASSAARRRTRAANSSRSGSKPP